MPDSKTMPPLDQISVVVPTSGDLQDIFKAPDIPPFSKELTDFVAALSRALMKDTEARAYPEIISLAHWMRPRALLDLSERFTASHSETSIPLARGVALHFAPGNVDTIFLYSALLAVLTGNRNIVRISSRQSPQIELLVRVLNSLLENPEFSAMRSRLFIVRYGHDAEITAALSNVCDLRVIWGGDETVASIRAIPLPARSRDVSFPNRWSLAVIQAQAVLDQDETKMDILAKNFANDAYWFGQMACSSPRLAVWVGDKSTVTKASDRFWNAVRQQAKQFGDEIAPVSFVNKLVAQNIAAIEGSIKSVRSLGDNVVSVGELTDPSRPEDDLCVGEGLFWDARIENLEDLAPVLDNQSQTLISHGIPHQRWVELIQKQSLRIDRIVPFGVALQFGHVWDGVDLLVEFSRIVSLEA